MKPGVVGSQKQSIRPYKKYEGTRKFSLCPIDLFFFLMYIFLKHTAMALLVTLLYAHPRRINT